MKIKVSYILIFILFMYSKSYSENPNEISLDNLQIPNSPAFILLDVAPTSIDRPTSSKAFAASIINSVRESNGIPRNYAVEFTPYWFFKHQGLSALKYWGIDKEDGGQLPFSLAQRFSFSLATVQNDLQIDSINKITLNNISAGVRMTLINIRNTNDISDLLKLNSNHIKRLKKLNEDNIDKSPSEVVEIIDKDKELMTSNERIKEILNRKPVFSVDFALASSWSFMGNDYTSGKFNRLGSWLTLSYSNSLNSKDSMTKNDYLNFYAVSRYLIDQHYIDKSGSTIKSNLFDTGGKLEFEFGKISLSYEYLYRMNLDSNNSNTFRSSGMVQYAVNENLKINVSFGKNFGDFNNLISQIGLSWGPFSSNEKTDIE